MEIKLWNLVFVLVLVATVVYSSPVPETDLTFGDKFAPAKDYIETKSPHAAEIIKDGHPETDISGEAGSNQNDEELKSSESRWGGWGAYGRPWGGYGGGWGRGWGSGWAGGWGGGFGRGWGDGWGRYGGGWRKPYYWG